MTQVSEADLVAWVAGPLRRFFPFNKFLAFYGRDLGGYIEGRACVSWGHDPEFMSVIQNSCYYHERSCIAWWVSNRRPFVLRKGVAFDGQAVAFECRNCPTNGTKNCSEHWSQDTVAGHGIVDLFALTGTLLRFSGVPEDRQEERLAALELIAPVLHGLMLKVGQAERQAIDLTSLTRRQCEVIQLVMAGLSDKAIAERLAISEHTVGNHFRAIFSKLGIRKRGELVNLPKQLTPNHLA